MKEMLISLNNIKEHYTWLIDSEKYKSFKEEGYDMNDLIFVPDDCMKNNTNMESFDDVILMCNVISYWVIDFPQTFYDFCFNNQKDLLIYLQSKRRTPTIKYVYNDLIQSSNVEFYVFKDYYFDFNQVPKNRIDTVKIMYEISKSGNLIKYGQLLQFLPIKTEYDDVITLQDINKVLPQKDLEKLVQCISFDEELTISSFSYKYINGKWYLIFLFLWESYKLMITNFNKNSVCENFLKLGNDIGYNF